MVSVAGAPGAERVGGRWSDRVQTVKRADADLPAVMLVRPDGYVAWASDNPTPAGIEAAVTGWCGVAAFAPR